MSLTFTEQFLVVALSAVLLIFLITAIAALIKINQILKHIKSITEKAEKLTDQAQHVGDFFQKSAGSAAVIKLVSNIVSTVRDHKKHKEE